jgi:hypothetical protein
MFTFDENCKAITGRKQKCQVLSGLKQKNVRFFQDDTMQGASIYMYI